MCVLTLVQEPFVVWVTAFQISCTRNKTMHINCTNYTCCIEPPTRPRPVKQILLSPALCAVKFFYYYISASLDYTRSQFLECIIVMKIEVSYLAACVQ